MLCGLTGYVTPSARQYKAGMKVRNIEMQYRMLNSGIFIVDEYGLETDWELWNPINNPIARFVKYTNSVLCPGGNTEDNSVIISKNHTSQIRTKSW